MAWNQRDRAQLGEQSSEDRAMQANARSRDVSSEHRDQPVERQTIGERGKRERIDTTAGDEGVDDAGFTGARQRSERSDRESEVKQRPSKTGSEHGSQSRPGKSNERGENVHRMAGNEPRTMDQGRGRSGNEQRGKGGFSGQGGQQGGVRPEEREGTGYTRDRSGQLQHDDSQGGSQGRHGKSGSRQGVSGSPQTGTSNQERSGGQTAQNPRESRKR